MCLHSIATGDHENKVKLDHRIQIRIGKLKSDFGDIVVRALRWLRERYPEAQEAATWLNEMLRGHPSEPLVAEASVRNHDALRKLLQTKWSFTNSRFLQGLVESTEDEALIERMSNYNEEFKYVRRSIPINNQEVTFEDYDLNKPCLILIFESITYFNDIEIFLDEVFHIYRRYLRVHKIKPGCVEVTLQFPANMELLLQVCIDKKCESVKHYAKMHIISNKNQQTESPVDATSIDLISEQIFGSCIKEETREHNFIGVQKEDGPSSTTQGRDVSGHGLKAMQVHNHLCTLEQSLASVLIPLMPPLRKSFAKEPNNSAYKLVCNNIT